MCAPAAMPRPDSTMQPSITPSPSARAACAIRTASRIPPDFASLRLTPCARSAQARDVGERVAVLVDVDRDGRAALQLGAARVAGGERLLAVLERHLRQELERLVERPVLVHVDLERQVGRGAHGVHALEVEPVAAAELQLQAPEAAPRGRLGAPGHVVGIAEPDRPRGRRPGAPQPEQLVHGDAGELPLQVVQRRVERGARRVLAGRQRGLDLVERPRVVAELDASRARRAPRRPSGRSARSAPPRRTRRRPPCRTSTSTTSATSCD